MTQKSQEYEMDCQERRSILQGGEEVNSAAVHVQTEDLALQGEYSNNGCLI